MAGDRKPGARGLLRREGRSADYRPGSVGLGPFSTGCYVVGVVLILLGMWGIVNPLVGLAFCGLGWALSRVFR